MRDSRKAPTEKRDARRCDSVSLCNELPSRRAASSCRTVRSRTMQRVSERRLRRDKAEATGLSSSSDAFDIRCSEFLSPLFLQGEKITKTKLRLQLLWKRRKNNGQNSRRIISMENPSDARDPTRKLERKRANTRQDPSSASFRVLRTKRSAARLRAPTQRPAAYRKAVGTTNRRRLTIS